MWKSTGAFITTDSATAVSRCEETPRWARLWWFTHTKRHAEEFKRDSVALVVSRAGRSPRCPGAGISSESPLGWYRRAKADRGKVGSGELTGTEREELKRPRKAPRAREP
ncbi:MULTISPECIES: hypothetical protein [unclassified Streptomyces]|uniref:hypothetical protein n=1 Tax=unclassified Streptomyces TaxID=2593676 RepID=UPI0015E1B43F|nr:hypothetical protein [Streptomyces sp. SM10]